MVFVFLSAVSLFEALYKKTETSLSGLFSALLKR